MKREYCNRGFDNYYTITLEGNQYNYEANILIGNEFVYLLPVDIKACDNNKIYEYRINTMQPFKDFLDGCKLSYDELSRIIIDVINCMTEIEEYLLSVNNLIVNVDDIFVDIKSNALRFCYGEGYNKIITNQIKELIEVLINRINPQDKQGTEYIYNLYEYMQGYNMSMEGFVELANRNYYEQEVSGGYAKKVRVEGESNQVNKESIQISKENIKLKKDSILKKIVGRDKSVEAYKIFCTNAIILDAISMAIIIFRIIKGIANSMDYKLGVVLLVLLGVIVFLLKSGDEEMVMEETNVNDVKSKSEKYNRIQNNSSLRECKEVGVNTEIEISNVIQAMSEDNINRDTELMVSDTGDEETVLLVYKNKVSSITLISQKSIINNIYLDKQSNIIGSSNVRCNIVVQDSGISRVHATIFLQNNNWYITDLDSTNGTYVNNCKIQSGLAIIIKDNDKLAFAQSVYIVSMEM